MKTKLLFWCVVLLMSSTITAQTLDQLPENPVPGKCYVKCILPDEFEEVTETVIVEPAYKKIVTYPPTYKTVEEEVLVKEASKKLVYVPAVYEKVEVEYVSKAASKKLNPVDATFGTDSKTFEVYPATSKWEYNIDPNCSSPNVEDCMIACFVEYPGKSERVNQVTLVKDAYVTEEVIEEQKSFYEKLVVKTPARVDEIEVPAEYATIKRIVVDQPARVEEVTVPAVTKSVTRTVLVKKGGMAVWEEIDCELLDANVLPILYELNSAIITPDSKKIIDDNLLELLNQRPNIRVEIMSHTDSRGSAEYNMVLSQQRAQSVVNYLVSKGIKRDRLIANGFGMTKLKNKCTPEVTCTEAEHQVNRRTEFRIIQ